MSPSRRILFAATVVVAYALPLAEARGDEFQLANGGAVRGALVDRSRHDDDPYKIRSDAGITITLDSTTVEAVVPQLPANEEYEARRAAAADTVEDQWALAEWCREQSLSPQRRIHLERVIELDPDNAEARRALRYFKRDGRWVTQEQINTERGLVLYKGRWITQQKARILKEEEAGREREGVWQRRVQRYASQLGTPRGEQAAQLLRQINDAAAVPAIKKHLLGDPRPSYAPLRLLALEPLAAIGTPAAKELIAQVALYDNDEELRLSATEYFEKNNNPDIVGYFISKLNTKDTLTINRAARVLATLGNEAAVDPLIDVLITTQTRTVTQGTPGGVSTGFGSGGGGLSVGSKTYNVNETSFNEDVYDALRKLTGQDYGRSVDAWKRWHHSRRAAVIDAREGG